MKKKPRRKGKKSPFGKMSESRYQLFGKSQETRKERWFLAVFSFA
jgi:hypothetical protein